MLRNTRRHWIEVIFTAFYFSRMSILGRRILLDRTRTSYFVAEQIKADADTQRVSLVEDFQVEPARFWNHVHPRLPILPHYVSKPNTDNTDHVLSNFYWLKLPSNFLP